MSVRITDDVPLIVDDDARKEVEKRAAKLFGPANMKEAARFLAATHIRATDYLEQAPVLAIAAMAGGGKLNGGRANRSYAAFKLQPLCERGARLRDVMAAYHLPLPLRKFGAKSLSMDYERAIAVIAGLPTSVLSQAIPDAITRQRQFLSAFEAWLDVLKRRSRRYDHLISWVVPQLSKHRITPTAAADLADFACAGGEPINPVWEWPRAEAAARDWHDHLSAGDAKKQFGVMADQIVDLGTHPDHLVVDDYEFVALRTPIAIHAEGRAMRHCVASYVGGVINGKFSIVSIQQDERRLATLQLEKGRIAQLKARFNRLPTQPVADAARKYVGAIKRAAA